MNLDVNTNSVETHKVFKPGPREGYSSAIYPVGEPAPSSASPMDHTLAAVTTGHEGNLRNPFF